MESKELMVGDYLYCELEKRVIHVEEVRESLVRFDRYTLSALGCGLLPIPLTDEILDANCGRYEEIRAATRWNIQIPGRLCLDIYRWRGDDHYEVFNGIEIRYVHELQHALRLCGEYEMADSLKLK